MSSLSKLTKNIRNIPYLKTLNLTNARTIFRRNSFFLASVRKNFKGNKEYRKDDYMCVNCLNLNPPVFHADTQESLLRSCQGNMDLIREKDMSRLENEAKFYRDVAERQIQLFGG